ncbi:MAG: quinoprotein relay system zinc metallohydrolase 2 [Thauera sp.]|uniref:quinoprotein relay system zinc metallohydrolase 2 n=1 Tax=Thauera sp. JM12B12 TaxID=3142262 RepID=UPI0029C47912|nr:quinoprotein relay system zinc metallohydrolase 2 [Thauera sp.]
MPLLARPLRCTIVACLLAWASAATAAADIAPLPVAEIAPGVHVHGGHTATWPGTRADGHASDVANTGFIVGARCVAVIDTGGSPALGARLLAALRRVTALPVCYVINTHVHPDHTLGNAAFAALEPRPRFVGHAHLAASLAARAPFYREALARELGVAVGASDIVFPDLAVTGRSTLELGGRRLVLHAWPTAHTDNDLSVLDESSATLFAGDLLFIGHLPVIDGRLLGWLGVMDGLAALRPTRIVPGHGAPTADWEAALATQRAYLEGVRDGIRAAIADGRTIATAVEGLADTGTDGWLLVEDYHRRNLTAAYAELEWED